MRSAFRPSPADGGTTRPEGCWGDGFTNDFPMALLSSINYLTIYDRSYCFAVVTGAANAACLGSWERVAVGGFENR